MEERKRFGWALVLALCLPLSVQAKTLYVDANAVGLNNGSSWVNARRYLQDALADASALAKPVEIRIGQGTYRPDQGAGVKAGDKAATFRMLNGVTIKGGYAGLSAPDPNAWDPSLYQTRLWGDLADNDDFARLSTANDNTHHIVTASGTDANAILEGVTIARGAYTSGRLATIQGGGGVYNQAGRPTIRSCTFSHNVMRETLGSAMVNFDGAAPHLEDCTFENNHGYVALYDKDSATVLTNCRFMDNPGTAIQEEASQITCENCSFTNNGGTALSMSKDCRATVSNCVFTGNHSAIIGSYVPCSVVCTDSVFTGNGGTGPMETGAVFMITGTFVRCQFRDNVGAAGGAIYGCFLTLEDCTFIRNSAKSYGAVRCITGDVNRCLFVGNRAKWEAGALYVRSQCELTNCTIAGNRSMSYGAIGLEDRNTVGVLTNCIIHDNFCQVPTAGDELTWSLHATVTYSCLPPPPWQLHLELVGCFDTDPCFVKPGYWDPNGTSADMNDDFWVDGDYHLQSQAGHWDPNSETWVADSVTSPCIDTGDPNSLVGEEPQPNGGRINMGCYGGTSEASKSHLLGSPMIFFGGDAWQRE